MKRPIVALRWILSVLVGSLSFWVFAGGPPEQSAPEVDSRAMEVRVARHGATLWRYTRFNAESDYPCLRFEAIRPGENWRVIDRQDVCDLVLPDGQLLVFENTAYTGFTGVRFSPEEPAFKFGVEYIRKTAAGEIRLECRLPVSDSHLGAVACR
ncbi:hypothetical protein C7H09_05845 [Marinobacter fuscus]|uniref:DUF1850 domain-containing protein n=1 Tax=Marinobacter fuscus TaxID=2109942 RepID=A0A2T1KQH5_9GAMM|nr:hypothetical protein [Marinobacter fuscus]PSF11882.1 hypothetical protein C7H09_05845 [Marinobacter fuscus]